MDLLGSTVGTLQLSLFQQHEDHKQQQKHQNQQSSSTPNRKYNGGGGGGVCSGSSSPKDEERSPDVKLLDEKGRVIVRPSPGRATRHDLESENRALLKAQEALLLENRRLASEMSVARRSVHEATVRSNSLEAEFHALTERISLSPPQQQQRHHRHLLLHQQDDRDAILSTNNGGEARRALLASSSASQSGIVEDSGLILDASNTSGHHHHHYRSAAAHVMQREDLLPDSCNVSNFDCDNINLNNSSARTPPTSTRSAAANNNNLSTAEANGSPVPTTPDRHQQHSQQQEQQHYLACHHHHHHHHHIDTTATTAAVTGVAAAYSSPQPEHDDIDALRAELQTVWDSRRHLDQQLKTTLVRLVEKYEGGRHRQQHQQGDSSQSPANDQAGDDIVTSTASTTSSSSSNSNNNTSGNGRTLSAQQIALVERTEQRAAQLQAELDALKATHIAAQLTLQREISSRDSQIAALKAENERLECEKRQVVRGVAAMEHDAAATLAAFRQQSESAKIGLVSGIERLKKAQEGLLEAAAARQNEQQPRLNDSNNDNDLLLMLDAEKSLDAVSKAKKPLLEKLLIPLYFENWRLALLVRSDELEGTPPRCREKQVAGSE